MNGKRQNLKVAAIVQARLGSTRLPGKIFKELSGKPMLWHVVNRLSHSKLIDEIIVATTILPEDDRVQEFCEMNNILFYRGSPEDVLSRYYETAKKFEIDIIIRITSDCPVIDPFVVDTLAEFFLEEKVDYVSNNIIRTFPRGLDSEIFSFYSLAKAYNEASQQYEREHVTSYIYNHPDLFTFKNFSNKTDYSFHRWTVDTQEDFLLIENIYNALYNEKKLFLFKDILELFEKNPDLIRINQNIQQKKLGE